MKTIISEKLPRILKNKKQLEKKLNVKITNRGKEVTVNGSSEDEFVAEKVIQAINFGFPFSYALLIKEEDFEFVITNIKEHTRRKDLARVRARIIGKGGKTLSTLNTLTQCYFEMKDNFVGIIGSSEHIKNAEESIASIAKGTKQSNVYAHLEKNQVKRVIDLGLK